MSSDVLSIRIAPATRERLDRAARRGGTSRSALVQRLVEEGIRMDAHPGIVFRDGPAGRRPAVQGGPDVWEVVRVVANSPERGERAIEAAALWLALHPGQVRAAVDYYAAWPDEVDAWIARVDAVAAEVAATEQARADVLR